MLDEFLQLAVAKVIMLHFYLTEKLKVMQDIDHLKGYIFKKQIMSIWGSYFEKDNGN